MSYNNIVNDYLGLFFFFFVFVFFFFFKQKTAYEMCGRDWSSDVCSSDLKVCLLHLYASCKVKMGKRTFLWQYYLPCLSN